MNRDSLDHCLPWVRPFTDQPGFARWFERTVDDNVVAMVAREREGGAVVGVINFNEIVLRALKSAYLGYWSNVRTAGRGLMTESMAQAIGFGFAGLGLHRLEANIQPGNARSLSLVRRLGFNYEGFSPRYLMVEGDWRDHERWALLADGWPAEPVSTRPATRPSRP